MDNSLTSGVLKDSLQNLFGNGEDEYQFENKEYLIMIEKDNISISDPTPSINNKKAYNVPQVKNVMQIKKSNNLLHSKNGDLIEPKCIPSNPFSYSIDKLLGLLEYHLLLI